MIRTQIQLPDRLHRRLRTIAQNRESSLAELIRQGMENFADTCLDEPVKERGWQLPVLRPSGGYRKDPAEVRAEADAVEERSS